MVLNLANFFRACSPAYRLDLSKSEDRKYYIDFSSVQGNVIEELEQTITKLSPDTPTYQLFTGHIGCGKSTALSVLQAKLEQQGFHTVYFESTQDLDMADVDISDILLSIAHQVSQSLEEFEIPLKLSRFKILLKEVANTLNANSRDLKYILSVLNIKPNANPDTLSFSLLIEEITAISKKSRDTRALLRKQLEPKVKDLIEVINEELLEPGIHQLKLRGKKGLVVLVDNLDRIDNTPKLGSRTQPEYLFIDRCENLREFNCHIIYTIPITLTFSKDQEILTQRFGGTPKFLPMVRVKERDGSPCEMGMNLLRQMILNRAFPDIEPDERFSLVSEIFEQPETLNRICQVSGGHLRNLLILLSNCIQKDDPPFSRHLLERVIRERRNELSKAITPKEWELITKVAQSRVVRGEEEYKILLRSLFVFEYYDNDSGRWFDINPILAESKEFLDFLEKHKEQDQTTSKAITIIQRFLKQLGAIIKFEKTNTLEIQSISSQLTSYAPLPIMFAECPVEKDVVDLQTYANKLRKNTHTQVGLLLYQKQADSLFRIRMAEVRLRDHFVLIPIPFAAVEQALTDEATSRGLLAQYVGRYLPGADLFDDRNAIGDTLSFYGRGNLLHSLEEDLRRCQGIGLLGLRKSGKTSVLLQLEFVMRQHPVVYIDLQPYGGKLRYGAELFQAILQKLLTKLRGGEAEFELNLAIYQRDRPAKEIATNFTEQVCELMNLLANAGYKVPIICFLDEVERIFPSEKDSKERVEEFNAFFGALRELSQTQKRLSLLVADVHPDFNRTNHWCQASVPTNPVFNFFKEVFIPAFHRQDTATMLTEIGRLMGVEFEEDILLKIHQDSGGHPFIARQLGSLLYQKVDRDKNGQTELISLEKAKRYLDKPFRHSDIIRNYFKENIWADLQKRNFHTAMTLLKFITCNEALSEGVNEEVLFDKLSNDFSESECESAILWLEKVGLILLNERQDEESYQMNVRLMSNWLRREMRREEIQQWTLH